MTPFSVIKEFVFLSTLIVSLGFGAWEMAYGAQVRVDPITQAGHWQLDASSIQVSGFSGVINVIAESRSDIEIVVSRDSAQTQLPEIRVSPEGVAVIEQVAAKAKTGISVTSAGSSIVVVNGVEVSSGSSVLRVTGNTNAPAIALTARVPHGTALSILSQQFEVSIGDVSGPVELQTTADATLGAVSSAKLHVSGNGSVDVASVSQEVAINAAGNAQIRIDRGVSPMVRVRAEGNADVAVEVEAIDADVSASGNATVELMSVKAPPQLSILGNADVVVGE